MLYNQIGEKGLNQTLVKRLLLGGDAPSGAVAPEIFPVLVLENDRPEQSWLRGELLFGLLSNIAAGGAGTRSSITYCNVSTNLLVTFTRIQVAVTGATVNPKIYRLAPGILPFGIATANGVPRDGRIISAAGTIRGSSTRVITDNTLGVVGGNSLAALADLQVFQDPIVLGPGTALYLSASADNVAIGASAQWRERLAEPSELV